MTKIFATITRHKCYKCPNNKSSPNSTSSKGNKNWKREQENEPKVMRKNDQEKRELQYQKKKKPKCKPVRMKSHHFWVLLHSWHDDSDKEYKKGMTPSLPEVLIMKTRKLAGIYDTKRRVLKSLPSQAVAR